MSKTSGLRCTFPDWLSGPHLIRSDKKHPNLLCLFGLTYATKQEKEIYKNNFKLKLLNKFIYLKKEKKEKEAAQQSTLSTIVNHMAWGEP